MSLYRQATGPSTRVALLAAVIALIVGGLAGYVIGRETAPEPSFEELVSDARAEARPAASAIELVGIEYAEAVTDAGEVVAETEYEAARSQAQLAVDTLASASGLRTLNPEALQFAEVQVDEVADLVDRTVEPRLLRGPLGEAQAALSALTGEGISAP